MIPSKKSLHLWILLQRTQQRRRGFQSGKTVVGSPRDLAALTRSQLQSLQTALNQRGFASGTPDGIMGPVTRDGIRRYQRSAGLPADGYPDADMLQRLQSP